MTSGHSTDFSTLNPIPLSQVKLGGGFWGRCQEINHKRTLPAIYNKLQETGHIDAFLLCKACLKNQAKIQSPRVQPFWDSDVAKWVEAASYTLATMPDSQLDSLVDSVIEKISEAQGKDGYLNTYFTVAEPEYRWGKLAFSHELYCAGHLIEAGVAHYQATQKAKLLDTVRRYADYIYSVFATGKCKGYPGHPEIELALVKLYRITEEKRYLELSQIFLERRGQKPSYFKMEMESLPPEHTLFYRQFFGVGENFSTAYCQDHLPIREQREAVGHAVRAMYLYSGMVDVAVETKDAELLEVCKNLWEDVVTKHMYITGGIGSSKDNEGFTKPYDLPNRLAYAESCAAIGLVFFSHRLLQVDPDSKYADIMEKALYNGVLIGVSLDGYKFFYDNPLESEGNHHRQEWFEVACCPPNLARLIDSMGNYIYSQKGSDIYVHLYTQGEVYFKIENQKISLNQQTDYPWDGKVEILVQPERLTKFGLNLRISKWAPSVKVTINEEVFKLEGNVKKGYLRILRTWQPGDRVSLTFSMLPQRVFSHPKVNENAGCVALERGPVVFCLEEIDHDIPLHQIFLPFGEKLDVEFRSDFMGGVPVITAQAKAIDDSQWNKRLYCSLPPTTRPCRITALPYFACDNRSPSAMRVWIKSCR